MEVNEEPILFTIVAYTIWRGSEVSRGYTCQKLSLVFNRR